MKKKGFTVLCTFDAAGNKYAPILISIGTTQVSERNWFGGGRNIANPHQKKNKKLRIHFINAHRREEVPMK